MLTLKGHTQKHVHRCTPLHRSVSFTHVYSTITCSHDLHFSLTLTFVACLFFHRKTRAIFYFLNEKKQKFIIFYGSQFFISHKPKHTHVHTYPIMNRSNRSIFYGFTEMLQVFWKSTFWPSEMILHLKLCISTACDLKMHTHATYCRKDFSFFNGMTTSFLFFLLDFRRFFFH